ncbi:MAG: NADH-quinone oxidoreductase subunit K [Bacteroidia bacterium]
MALVLFAAGLYLLFSRPHGLWLLIGLELMLNASAPLLVAAGSVEAITLLFVLLFFALLEAAAALFILYHYAKLNGSLSLNDLSAL